VNAAKKHDARLRRHHRIRRKIHGSSSMPRLAVYRSNRHIYAQLVDDVSGRTLAAASSLDESVEVSADKKSVAKAVGGLIAQRAKDAGIERVVFDRGGFLYQGRVKELADAAREGGLKL
jgi:large subunit ribosomal protein L18